jgi:hypothetical protein
MRPHPQVRAVNAYESWREVIVPPLEETSDVVCTRQDQRQEGAIHTSMETSVRGARYTRACSTVLVDARLKGSMAPKCAFLGSQGIPLMQYARAVMVTAWMLKCPGGEHLRCSQWLIALPLPPTAHVLQHEHGVLYTQLRGPTAFVALGQMTSRHRHSMRWSFRWQAAGEPVSPFEQTLLGGHLTRRGVGCP